MLRLAGTGVSHPGLVRSGNEDSAIVGPDLLLVADGVGGAAAGEIASATAAYAVAATAMQYRDEEPMLVLARAVRSAQAQVARGIEQDSSRRGMATTLTAVLTNGTTCALAHLGDSRAYVRRDDELIRVSRDHTWVAGLVDEGDLTEQEVANHPLRNVVTRSVDGDVHGHADVLPLALRPGDRVLVASDGLTDLVAEDEIAEVLARHGDDRAVDLLLTAALENGGRDNVTIVLATVIDGPRVLAAPRLLGAVRDPGNIVDPAAVRQGRSA